MSSLNAGKWLPFEPICSGKAIECGGGRDMVEPNDEAAKVQRPGYRSRELLHDVGKEGSIRARFREIGKEGHSAR
jgi:hypothetical protein